MSATQSSPIQMPIDVVSDVVCPWCFIGKRRLEKALALRPDIAAEVRWRPYFLNDWIPREGIDRRTYLETKFGSAERYAAIAERVAAAARSEGLDYALDKIARQPNTLDCHRLILWARNTSDAGRMKQRLMELYFSAGADLTDVEVLVGAAVDCGMDGEVVSASSARPVPPRRPASTACPASSSATCSRSQVRRIRPISPTRWDARQLNMRKAPRGPFPRQKCRQADSCS